MQGMGDTVQPTCTPLACNAVEQAWDVGGGVGARGGRPLVDRQFLQHAVFAPRAMLHAHSLRCNVVHDIRACRKRLPCWTPSAFADLSDVISRGHGVLTCLRPVLACFFARQITQMNAEIKRMEAAIIKDEREGKLEDAALKRKQIEYINDRIKRDLLITELDWTVGSCAGPGAGAVERGGEGRGSTRRLGPKGVTRLDYAERS